MSSISGVYINLDESKGRRHRCETLLVDAKLQARYKRLPAILGKGVVDNEFSSKFSPAKLGCWLSHIKAQEFGLQHGGHHHVLEDDFLLTPVFYSFLQRFDVLTEPLKSWDIIFTDVDISGMRDVSTMSQLVRRVERLIAEQRVVFQDARSLFAAGNSSYIIHRDRKRYVFDLMRQGPETGLPNDLYMRKLIREGALKAFVTLPFVTSVSDNFADSTIWGSIMDTNPSIAFATMFRQSLAFGADTKQILQKFRRGINQLQPISNRGMIYAQLVAHFVSDDYKPY